MRLADWSEPRWTGSWCPQCGPDVACDEDGCCAGCGATAIGEGAEQALALRRRAGGPSGEDEISSDCPACGGIGLWDYGDEHGRCRACGGTGVTPDDEEER